MPANTQRAPSGLPSECQQQDESTNAGMECLAHIEVAQEAVSILRGAHPAWKGDRILNAETFLRNVGRDFGMSRAFADDLESSADEFSELLGVSPERVLWMANRVREGNALTD